MTGGSGVVVIDNGGGLLKAGFGGNKDPIAVVPNCIAKSPGTSANSKKWLAADQLQAQDIDVTGMALRRPIDRGYLINTEVQREVWERVLRNLLQVDPTNSSLLLVEPQFNPPGLQHATDKLVFEEFGFSSLCIADAPSLVHLYEASQQPSLFRAQCSLVVDCGFSFTHASPVLQNFTLNYAVRRMDLGGKALTISRSLFHTVRLISWTRPSSLMMQRKRCALYRLMSLVIFASPGYRLRTTHLDVLTFSLMA